MRDINGTGYHQHNQDAHFVQESANQTISSSDPHLNRRISSGISSSLSSRLLSKADIEAVTGIPSDQQSRQVNYLRRQGIRCFVSCKKELIVLWSWLDHPQNLQQQPTSSLNSVADDHARTLPRFGAVRGYGAN